MVTDAINEVFAYNLFIQIWGKIKCNQDSFMSDNNTRRAIAIIKDLSKINNYSKDTDISKVVDLEHVIFELSYYFHDTQIYSTYKYKEYYFGLEVDVPSTEEVEAMFVMEDIERPKKQIQADIEAWENR
jgi:hypothetical protein